MTSTFDYEEQLGRKQDEIRFRRRLDKELWEINSHGAPLDMSAGHFIKGAVGMYNKLTSAVAFVGEVERIFGIDVCSKELEEMHQTVVSNLKRVGMKRVVIGPRIMIDPSTPHGHALRIYGIVSDLLGMGTCNVTKLVKRVQDSVNAKISSEPEKTTELQRKLDMINLSVGELNSHCPIYVFLTTVHWWIVDCKEQIKSMEGSERAKELKGGLIERTVAHFEKKLLEMRPICWYDNDAIFGIDVDATIAFATDGLIMTTRATETTKRRIDWWQDGVAESEDEFDEDECNNA